MTMPELAGDPLAYYATPGVMTDPGAFDRLLSDVPRDVGAMIRAVQGALLHVFWAGRYGVELSQTRQEEVQLRSAEEMLGRLEALDPSPLSVRRPLERRLVGNCRHFAVLLCTLLRHHGVPARVRCGFGTYFRPLHYEDHWACEYWDVGHRRWVLADPQLDALQCGALRIPFDPLDVPRDRFVSGGQAWLLCRTGEAEPSRFGISEMRGMAFIRGNVIRDLLALNKVEVLPWDQWGPIAQSEADAATAQVDLIDRLARLTTCCDELFVALRRAYEAEVRIYGAPERVAAGREIALSVRG